MKPIRKAVFPVAGLGTRFLPATKVTAKEMLPVIDKPLMQYATEEAIAAGITELIFVTGRTKRSIEDHFDSAPELERELEARGKSKELAQVREVLPSGVTCIAVRQAVPLGLGHAVLCAKPVVGNEPFAVILADDLIASDGDGCVSQMVKVYEKQGCSLVAVEEVPHDETDRYGIVSVSSEAGPVAGVDAIVEKPPPAEAPSNLGVVGRYVLAPEIFDALENTKPGAGGEIQLTDAIAALVHEGGVQAYRFTGKRYDCGSKLGYLQATVELARRHPELGESFRAFLAGLR
ncbi:MAG: UTP--glucose-1-phosphate uridylyltransferase GalU [Gammaproteobacteria bacterium]|nr:UTP--glucose-1-phosphate uridylyltransferase GalU [Gammaproteobacteria bacterium]NIM73598.1 UTP--glucose-1-phosphate uridylyltransferase GalU [Gammaproteobacteria bacterium]NIN40251.1 UTP--glucose-1-phosphate uridylyltransferase GalU [Gammaproteobacteria bacterium]NIO25413.1 UTP--glucose-1-phosphate uridylyltransferase GalU [Gammaproteobacteria bacterium]NIO66091.1 UTP--glucose-1-phosphate uridylyltransferase GalU [Gammaproteobacteria bacterium]